MRECLAEFAARGRAQADAAERLRHLGKIRLAEAVDLAPAGPERSAIGVDDESVFLIERGIVVADDDEVDAVARRRLELGQVVVEAAVAGPQHHLAAWHGALHADGAGEAPAERAGAADVALLRLPELDERARPHAGMAGVGDDDAIPRQRVRDLGGELLGAHRALLPVAPLVAAP